MNECCKTYLRETVFDEGNIKKMVMAKCRCDVCGGELLYNGKPAIDMMLERLVKQLLDGKIYFPVETLDTFKEMNCPSELLAVFAILSIGNASKGATPVLLLRK